MTAFPGGIKYTTTVIAVFLFSAIFLFGCNSANSNGSGDTRALVVINDYTLTVGDFKSEAETTYPSTYFSEDSEKKKKELLGDIIAKKVLLQEAQKQNFDKDKVFMKEIERYWEQALLKLLTEKKTEELAASINITEEEVRDEYNTLLEENGGDFGSYEKKAPAVKGYILQGRVQKEFNDWIGRLEDTSKVEVNEELLTEIKLNANAEE